MDERTTYSGEPYRAAPALGQDKWNVYAADDHRQERYIGRIIKEDDLYCIEKAYSDDRLEERAEDFEEAIDLLYALCKMSGYLTQGHENYLGQAEKKGAA